MTKTYLATQASVTTVNNSVTTLNTTVSDVVTRVTNLEDGGGAGMTPQQVADLAACVTDKHTHANKTVLDLTTAEYTTAEKTKLANITDNFKGLYADADARLAGVPTPMVGNYVLQEDTNTVWYYNGASWLNTGVTSAGDMLKAVYDPTDLQADAFSMDSMVETATKKVLTDAERAKLAAYRGHMVDSTAMLALAAPQTGHWCTRQDTSSVWLYGVANWVDTRPAVVNNLVTNSASSALSAAQGVVINTALNNRMVVQSVFTVSGTPIAGRVIKANSATTGSWQNEGAPFAGFGAYVLRCDSDDMADDSFVTFNNSPVNTNTGSHGVTVGTTTITLAQGFVYSVRAYLRTYSVADNAGLITSSWTIVAAGLDVGIPGAFASPDDAQGLSGSYPAFAFIDATLGNMSMRVKKTASGGSNPDYRCVIEITKISA